MSQKFLSNIELNAGLVDGNDATGTSGQVLTSTGTGVEWIDQAAITSAQSNKTYYEVKNSSGATILKGKGVMAVGTDGNSGHILIDEMVADGTVEPRYFMGVLEDSLDNGEIGTVIAFGELDQFNTTGQNGETWTNGQILWCDPDSAGDFTTTQPTAPAVKISAAFILKASTQGKIQIRVQANEGIHELHDTHITTQSDGEILVWDNTNEYWFNDGTLTVDYTNGAVGIGTTPSSLYKLNIRKDVNDPDIDFTFGQRIDVNLSGADNTTGDREQGGLWIDIDSSADGDASNEHRLYGIYNDVSFSGYSDIVRGTYTGVYSTNSTEKTAYIDAGHFYARQNSSSTSGGVSALRATFNYAYVDGAGDIDNAYGSYSYAQIASTRTENFKNVFGSWNEIQIDSTSTISGTALYGVASVIDNNTSGGVTASVSYLFRGYYLGDSLATTDYGLYITGEDNNYLESSLNIGTGNLQLGGTTVIDSSRNITASSFIKSGGTSSQFLKADGSVDSSSYSTTSHNHDSTYVNVTGDTMTGGLTSPYFRSTSGSTDFNLIARNNSSPALYVQNLGGADVFRVDYGSMTAGAGTTIFAANSSSSYFTSNLGIGTTNPQEELEVKSAQFTTVAVNTDRNTANENIGSFAFYGRNDAVTPENLLYSRIMSSMTDVTDGSENSDIFFQQINDGTVIETFRVSSAGTVDITGDLDVNGNLDTVNITATGTSQTIGSSNNETTSLTIRATNTAGSGSYATRINMIGYEGRAQGIFYLDETYAGKEWFSGLSYSAGFGNWQVGYDATGGKSEYTAQAYLTILESGNVGIGTDSPTRKLSVAGSIEAGGKTTYTKEYSSLDTTGSAVAGLTAGSNGGSACFIFTCFGGGGYQRVIYSCRNSSGTWTTSKDIDEGVNAFDVSASANGSTITFTFKARASSQSYSPTVTVEHHGSNLNTTYL